MDNSVTEKLSAFLVAAKRRTYAGLDDNATVASPLISGSKQLDYRDGDLSYRDIYFGLAYFVGQEVVSAQQQPIWSMSYAGGVSTETSDASDVLAIYAFLRKAMLRVDQKRPFRGPSQFEQDRYRYVDESVGELGCFHGAENLSAWKARL